MSKSILCAKSWLYYGSQVIGITSFVSSYNNTYFYIDVTIINLAFEINSYLYIVPTSSDIKFLLLTMHHRYS